MLKRIEIANKNITAYEVTGKLTKEDYKETLAPMVKAAKESERKLKLLLQFGEEFKGFTSGAAIEDFKLGMHNVGSFEKIAIVSDNKWISNSSTLIGSLIPAGVKTYSNKNLPLALNWLAKGNKRFQHCIDENLKILVIKLKGPLSSDQFSQMDREVDKWVTNNGELKGIVIQAKNFPGWRDIGSLISHVKFVRDNHKRISRVAFCADDKLTELIPKFANHFVKAHVNHFQFQELEKAKKWASHGHS